MPSDKSWQHPRTSKDNNGSCVDLTLLQQLILFRYQEGHTWQLGKCPLRPLSPSRRAQKNNSKCLRGTHCVPGTVLGALMSQLTGSSHNLRRQTQDHPSRGRENKGTGRFGNLMQLIGGRARTGTPATWLFTSTINLYFCFSFGGGGAPSRSKNNRDSETEESTDDPGSIGNS